MDGVATGNSDRKTELLAPSGNFESLKTAVACGANAVYLGLKEFSARAKADNFSVDELKSAVRYAHLFGVRVYVAINTLIKDSELDAAVKLACEAESSGADAIILQDLGLFLRLGGKVKIPLHASTQLGVHNVYGAKAAKKIGFDRVVLSRETTIGDIKNICCEPDLEVEAFVHGALCVAFSGNCYLSSLVGGYSGNRGKCMQLCRKKYTLAVDGKNSDGYCLSAKDLCRLDDMKRLIELGVMSFKIEGRMRRPEYVGASVAAYREAIDCLSSGEQFDSGALKERLKKVYNRGDYCRGYLGDPTESVVFPFVQGNIGVRIGTVEKVAGGIVVLKTDTPITNNDGLKFVGRDGETGGCLVTDKNKISFEGNVKVGDGVYRTTDVVFNNEIASQKKTIELKYEVDLSVGKVPTAYVSAQGVRAVFSGSEVVAIAKSAPLKKAQVEEIFLKGAEEPFLIKSVAIDMDDNIFMPIGAIKNLRRGAERAIAEKLTNALKQPVFRKNTNIMSDITPQFIYKNLKTLVYADSFEQLNGLNLDLFDAAIYSPRDYSDVEAICRVFADFRKPVFLDTPNIARDRDLSVLKRLFEEINIDCVVANNIYALELFRNKNILLGPEMNLLNSEFPFERIASFESDRIRISDYVIAYSRLPLMTLTHCPKKNASGKCFDCKKPLDGKLVDDRGNNFSLYGIKVGYCYARLLNGVPLYILDELVKRRHEKIVYDFRGVPTDIANAVLSEEAADFPHTHFNCGKALR